MFTTHAVRRKTFLSKADVSHIVTFPQAFSRLSSEHVK